MNTREMLALVDEYEEQMQIAQDALRDAADTMLKLKLTILERIEIEKKSKIILDPKVGEFLERVSTICGYEKEEN